MKLSLWHAKALYILSKLDLTEVGKVGEINLQILTHKAKAEDWVDKKEMYKELPEEKKYDLDFVELLVGKFRHEKSYHAFVVKLLDKLKNKGSIQTKQDAEEQFISRLGEYGMDHENAKLLIAQIKSQLVGNPSESEVVMPVLDAVRMTHTEKIDLAQFAYKALSEGHADGASELQERLRRHIAFFSRMIDQLDDKIGQNLPLEDLVNIQRYISYAATSLHKLSTLQYESSGVKTHIHHHAALAKLYGSGYVAMPRDEFGRITLDK
jgi:hypothetical protein